MDDSLPCREVGQPHPWSRRLDTVSPDLSHARGGEVGVGQGDRPRREAVASNEAHGSESRRSDQLSFSRAKRRRSE
jgi:hypothetical protein